MNFFYWLFMLIVKLLFGYDPEQATSFAPTGLPSTHSSPLLSTLTYPTTTSQSILPLTNQSSQCSFKPNSLVSNSTCVYGKSGEYCDECGLVFKTPNVKIVGGIEAEPGSWPSLVYIHFKYYYLVTIAGEKFIMSSTGGCGGSLIDRHTVLTAAHCYNDDVTYENEFGLQVSLPVVPNDFHDTIESAYTVYLGLYNKKNVEDGIFQSGPQGIAMKIKKYIIHPQYDPKSKLNDIGIIHLEEEAPLNCNIQIACLPNPAWGLYPTKTDIDAWAAGWGTLVAQGNTPDNLYNVKLTLYDGQLECQNYDGNDWNLQICAGEYDGGKDTCQGDSGGPLYIVENVNGKNKYIVAGVVSYGRGCGEPGYPGIYVRVSSYLKWIKENSKINF